MSQHSAEDDYQVMSAYRIEYNLNSLAVHWLKYGGTNIKTGYNVVKLSTMESTSQVCSHLSITAFLTTYVFSHTILDVINIVGIVTFFIVTITTASIVAQRRADGQMRVTQ